MRISVIIPIYNGETYIKRCLDSILQQTLKEIEIICVDDGSTDSTYEILREYQKKDDRIIILRQDNQGAHVAKKRGIEAANSEYITFVDSDDWIEPFLLENMLIKIAGTDMVSCCYYVETVGGYEIKRGDDFEHGVIENVKTNVPFLSRAIYDRDKHMLRPFSYILCNKLFRREILVEAVNRISSVLRVSEDALLLYRYLFLCKDITISDIAGYHYCYNGSSVTRKLYSGWLRDMGAFYVEMEQMIKEEGIHILSEQLQHWTTLNACHGLNNQMWENDAIWIPQYIADLSDVKNKKVVLYGAGRAGMDIYRQMRHFNYDVVAWLDWCYKDFECTEYKVMPPESIKEISYDIVYVAVASSNVAENIKQYLLGMGVELERIYWQEPMSTFG